MTKTTTKRIRETKEMRRAFNDACSSITYAFARAAREGLPLDRVDTEIQSIRHRRTWTAALSLQLWHHECAQRNLMVSLFAHWQHYFEGRRVSSKELDAMSDEYRRTHNGDSVWTAVASRHEWANHPGKPFWDERRPRFQFGDHEQLEVPVDWMTDTCCTYHATGGAVTTTCCAEGV